MAGAINVGPQTVFTGRVADVPFAALYSVQSSEPCCGRYCRDRAGRVYQEAIFGLGGGAWSAVWVKDPIEGRAYFVVGGNKTLVTPYVVAVAGSWRFPGLNPVRVGMGSIKGVPCRQFRLAKQPGKEFISDVWIAEDLVCVMRETGELASRPYIWEITEIAGVEPDGLLFRPPM